ncbi:hypothetical protein SEA_WATERT_49 [Microbacterium phage WaterT]|nr:hypothetical protein SEA_WATERT_49 [Microbacterium phage WaterT]
MLIGKIEKMADPLLATQRIVNYLGATKPLV